MEKRPNRLGVLPNEAIGTGSVSPLISCNNLKTLESSGKSAL